MAEKKVVPAVFKKSRTFPGGIKSHGQNLFSPRSSPQQVAGHSGKVRDKNGGGKKRYADKVSLVKRYFSRAGRHPFDEVKWEKRDIKISGARGTLVDAKGLEFPKFWSHNAASITGAKYFRGSGDKREVSVKQMITRVVKTITGWGETSGYFNTKNEAKIFEDELTHILLYQKAAFNSPVWFNVGIKEKPQCSACFILAVDDSMESIMEWISTEAAIFKGGSGAGVNLSALRSSQETLSNGGYSSGPVSFMRGADAVAGMIKSGGATRRAAKMVLLNIDHPDVMEFIRCKAEEEKKVRALMASGYNMQNLNDPGWVSIQFQNANNSVRLSDEFLKAVEDNKEWQTRFIKTGAVAETYSARELMGEISQAAWECADPGVHYKTTIDRWHTCPNTGPINGCNPCSEYMHLDNSACNLSSINLIHFLNSDGTFNVRDFLQAVDVMILAQEIIVGPSSYPTAKIEKTAHDFRELGLGFTNLSGLLMAKALAYDSEPARAWAGAITALMCGEAYRLSAEISSKMGAYHGYAVNKEPQLKVIGMHRDKVKEINIKVLDDKKLYKSAADVWDKALFLAKKYGVRNSQVTVIAPTGTIALMMDCACTGIEPLFAPLVYKQLVGGGYMKLVADTIPLALKKLNYSPKQSEEIMKWIEDKGVVEGAPGLKEEHLPVFDCAVKPANGTRSIHWQGHVKMVSAVQPFISGAISKTFNMPEETTAAEIQEAYLLGWKLGLKAFAVYRDGCKAAQPLSTKKSKKEETKAQLTLNVGPQQRKLPAIRSSETHKFAIAGHEGFLTYSIYEDNTLAEIFIRIAKQGSTLAGLLDTFAISVSMALQHGVPLKKLCHQFIHGRYEPMGFTENQNIPVASSITDYIFKYLALRFLNGPELIEFGLDSANRIESHMPKLGLPADGNLIIENLPSKEPVLAEAKLAAKKSDSVIYSGTVCKLCGGMMIRTGSCLTCRQCGEANGGC